MASSEAPSVKDKAREELESGIDVRKTRRRIEDVLRKSDSKTIIEVAKMLGVEVAELPSAREIFLADIWEKLEEANSVAWQHGESLAKKLALGDIMNKILDLLPPKFNTYFLISKNPNGWSRVSRDFFTKEAAEKNNELHCWEIAVNHLNVIQMRMTIKNVIKEIQEKSPLAPPFEPDEAEKVRQLKRILYSS